jgi:deferrochelatase/peroxidase EfeB
MPPASRTANVQGIVVRPSSKPFPVVLLFAIAHAEPARRFVRQWAASTPSGDGPEPPGPVLHFFFSWEGIERLLAGSRSLDVVSGRHEFEFVFAEPEQLPHRPAMSEQLGFHGDSDPAGWWEGRFTTDQIHVAVHALFQTAEQRRAQLEILRRSASECGLAELTVPSMPEGTLAGIRPPNGRIHFGYRDGVTQVPVDWEDAGTGGVDLREILTGYPNLDYPTAPQKPGPWRDFARDGSYVGLTWIYQDVARFERFLDDNEGVAARIVPADVAREWLAAKLMGRWRDGSALAHYPERPPAAPDLRDDFGYADDPAGLRTPLNSHIRIANCRDQSLNFANDVRFPKGAPRLIRRGFLYGPPLATPQDDGADRGLVGLFFCARLNEQLYTVLRWMQETEFSDVYAAHPNGSRAQDAIMGNRAKRRANTRVWIPKGDVELAPTLSGFIRFKGVAPLFAPGLHALAVLGGSETP